MSTTAETSEQTAERTRRRALVRAVVASTVGSSLAWFSYFLYGRASALVLPHQFFPSSDPYAAALVSFATYFVGFAVLPLGAAMFGHLGDRIGRRATLIATLLLLGLVTALMAAVPGYASIGIWGGVLMTVLRIVQGLCLGGEWAGAVLLSMEWGSGRRRGLVTSWQALGLPIGLGLGIGALPLLDTLFGGSFLAWGWRFLFLGGVLLIAVGIYVRLAVPETPVFRKLFEERRIEPAPVAAALRRSPLRILLSALIRVSEQAPFFVFTTFALAYGTGTLHLGGNLMLVAVLAAAAVALVTIPLAGYASDRLGRRRVYLAGAVLVGAVAFPYFGLLSTAVPALVLLGVVLSLIPVAIQQGPQAALIAENFTGRLRYSGASLGYQLASVVAGGPALVLAPYLLGVYRSSRPIAAGLVACALIGLGATLLIPDRSKVDHTIEYDVPAPATDPASSPTAARA